MFAEALNIVAERNGAKESVPEEKKNGSGPWVGAALPRKEEDRLLRGRGKFADDIKLREMLYLRFVRSPFAHARIVSVDTSAAEALPGVVCAITGKEVAEQTQPFIEIGPDHAQKIRDFPMAVGKAVYQGEPVAAVVAESPGLAEDAAELVQVEYEPLEPVVDAEQALTDHSILHEEAGTNRVWNGVWEYGEVERAFKEAAYVVDIDRLHFHRFSSTPLENNVVIAEWNPKDDRIYYWCNNSFPSFAIQFLAAHLNVHIDKIRVQTFDIGGSFGIKITSYPQMAVCALASKKAGGRPVKWVETRSEHMVSSAHGNERTFRNTHVALDKNGVLTAIDSRHIDDCGAYPRYEPLGCVIWSQVFWGLSFQERPHRFLASSHQQVSRRPQSRILAHAASLVPRARRRYLCSRNRHRARRNAPAQLHPPRRVPLHHAQRLRVRLGRLSEDARSRQGPDRLGRLEEQASRGAT
jgi:2-furoyl-CoA dehydrogenase large subunit